MTKIINLWTTLRLLDLGAVGINHPPALPVVVPQLHAPRKTTRLKRSDYHNVMNKPKPPKTIDELSPSDIARMIQADKKRQRKLNQEARRT